MNTRLTAILAAACTPLAALAPVAGVPAASFAQAGLAAPVAEASMRPRIYAGATESLDIVVRNAGAVSPPDLSGLKDFDVGGMSTQEQMTIVNGVVSRSTMLRFQVVARRTGTLSIPALEVVADGRTLRTQAFTVEAVEPARGEGHALAIAAERADAYVGQPVRVRLTWTLGSSVQGARISLPVSGAEADVVQGPEAAALHPADPRGVAVLLNGEQTLALIEQRPQTIVTVDRVVIPRRPGVVTVGPARADYEIVVRDARGFGSVERRFSEAPAVEIHAADLPTAGRPADFSGLVGKYAMTASVDTASVSVGDPIQLTVRVTGPYPLTSIPPLDLTRQPSLAGKFRVPRDPVLPEAGPTSASFTSTIRARSADVGLIGPLTLPYFDPDKGQYAVATAAPIPIKVTGGNTIDLPDAAADAPAPAVAARDPRTAVDDAPLTLGDAPFDLRRALASPVTIATTIIPPTIAAVAWFARLLIARAERDPARRRRQRALRSFVAAGRRAAQARDQDAALQALSHALGDLAADLFGRPAAVVAGGEAAERFRATGLLEGERLAELLDLCDRARFGRAGSRPGAPELWAAARSHAAALVRSLSARRRSA